MLTRMPVALRVTVVDAALDAGAAMWGDGAGSWEPPAQTWLGTLSAAGVPVRGLCDAGGDDGEGLLVVPEPDAWPDLVAQAQAARRPLLLGAPPDGANVLLAAVRDALGALVRPDLRGVLLLRLDDPGAAGRRWLDWWAHDDVAPAAWDALWRELDGFGRASVFCCPGWVCEDGRVVDSRTQNPKEWAALDAGVRAGVADLECHGYTHMHPDTAAWGAAADRCTSADWYREFWPPRAPVEPSVEAQTAILDAWAAACGAATSLVAPGEAWGVRTLAAARSRGYALFNSWGICRLQEPVPTWSVGIGSPYLDEADPAWLADGLPAVGYWHDRDMALHGPGWVGAQLSAWRDCGARRAWAFADLARAYAVPVDVALVDGEVVVRRAPRDVPLLLERRAVTG
jgi:hypothetical protein